MNLVGQIIQKNLVKYKKNKFRIICSTTFCATINGNRFEHFWSQEQVRRCKT